MTVIDPFKLAELLDTLEDGVYFDKDDPDAYVFWVDKAISVLRKWGRLKNMMTAAEYEKKLAATGVGEAYAPLMGDGRSKVHGPRSDQGQPRERAS